MCDFSRNSLANNRHHRTHKAKQALGCGTYVLASGACQLGDEVGDPASDFSTFPLTSNIILGVKATHYSIISL